jgi:hypothetical protein
VEHFSLTTLLDIEKKKVIAEEKEMQTKELSL